MMISVLLLLAIYNGFNMYCDIRWRITKNIWHLAFLLVFLGLAIAQDWRSGLWVFGWGCVAFLIYGLILEKVGSTAPGDTKMMMTNGLGICAYLLAANGGFIQEAMRNSLMLYLGSLVLILLAIDIFRFGRKYGVKQVVKTLFGSTLGVVLAKFGLSSLAPAIKLDNKDFRILPGAVMIALSVGLTAVVFYPV